MATGLRHPFAVAVVACTPLAAAAEEPRDRLELGFVPFGLSVTSEDDSFTIVGVPAPAPAYAGFFRGLYLQWFATRKLAVEPQISAVSAFSDGESVHMISLATRLTHHFSGTDRPSAYVFGSGGIQYTNPRSGDSDSSPSLGAGVGYRWPVRSASVRVEAAYERAFYDWGSSRGANVLGVAVGLALRF